MGKKLLFIIDSPETLKPEKDTSLLMMKTSINLGHQVFFCSFKDISIKKNIPFGNIKLIDKFDNGLSLFTEKSLNLNSLDTIFIRKDPPFDKDYLFLTMTLDLLKTTKVINNPKTLQSHNEKLSILKFPKIIPPTLVSSNYYEFQSFIKKHKSVVCKPIDEMGGNKIFLINQGNPNTKVILEVLSNNFNSLIMLQEYIPDIKYGDKRIIIINGDPIEFGLLRIPQKSDFRGNLAKGGRAKLSRLTKNDLKIINILKPYLINNNLNFVGIDVIGNFLTEINVTSPTGLVEIEQLSKKNVSKKIIQALV
ncbi:MAG: glutathione synthase [Proteobacteria bacterium]|nr:glutathione synthase [Pseudomonadota bacterium]MDA0941517.1 glutathione synthase [Pseudomonadota bacterium]MDA1034274.1 glutathione synthase [Pseudomonadota bacterium]